MKFILTIWVCSFLGQNACLPPIQHSTTYESWYECSRAAHKESAYLLSKMGYAYVNKYQIGMKYTCKRASTI